MTQPDDPAMPVSNTGLTKREVFTLYAMQAMISRGVENVEQITEWAVKIADATLLQLNRMKK